MTRPRLALFDLDHTLLLGDTDVLWCEFLMRRGVIARAEFEQRNRDIEAHYRAIEARLGAEKLAQLYALLDELIALEVSS